MASLAVGTSIAVTSCRNGDAVRPVEITRGKYGPAFSTYIGGSGEDTVRDVVFDSSGNVYITGGTASADFPTTPGTFSRTFSAGGTSTGSAGAMDVYVAKFSPSGQLLWSTYLGGPNYDRAYAIKLDSLGNVIVAGRAGEGFPTTPGTVQPTFGGHLEPLGGYGKQDGFVAKLSADGTELLWSTYFGGDDMSFIRSFDIDPSDNLYIALAAVTRTNPHITPGALQTELAGRLDGVVAKLTPDARKILWATYLGGTEDDSEAPSIKVNKAGEPIVLLMTRSSDIPTTANAFDTTYNGDWDFYVARLNAAGSQLIYGTFLGGSGEESLETHSLALDEHGNAYITGCAGSADYPTTPGAFQESHNGGQCDVPLSKLSADGSTLLASTFLGGEGIDAAEGIQVVDSHSVIVGGTTNSVKFPKTELPIQADLAGGTDFFMLRLDQTLSRLLYSSYLGGSFDDSGRTIAVNLPRVCVAGMTSSDNFPLVNAFQPTRVGLLDGAIAQFTLSDIERPAIPGTSR